MYEDIIREVVTKHSYYLSDACIAELAERFGDVAYELETAAYWEGRDYDF